MSSRHQSYNLKCWEKKSMKSLETKMEYIWKALNTQGAYLDESWDFRSHQAEHWEDTWKATGSPHKFPPRVQVRKQVCGAGVVAQQ